MPAAPGVGFPSRSRIGPAPLPFQYGSRRDELLPEGQRERAASGRGTARLRSACHPCSCQVTIATNLVQGGQQRGDEQQGE